MSQRALVLAHAKVCVSVSAFVCVCVFGVSTLRVCACIMKTSYTAIYLLGILMPVV